MQQYLEPLECWCAYPSVYRQKYDLRPSGSAPPMAMCATYWSLCVLLYEVLPLSSVMYLYFIVPLAEFTVTHS